MPSDDHRGETGVASRGEPVAPTPLVIKNARIFDGTSETLIEGRNVLVDGGRIVRIGPDAAVEGAVVVDAAGRTLMPGLIYMHEHLMMQMSTPDLRFMDDRYKAIVGARMAELYLMQGVTTVRDAAGNVFGLKLAIDRGLTPGPRIYGCGPMISQTSGHADHRVPTEPSLLSGGHLDPLIRSGDFVVADGVPAVLTAVREALRQGAAQIKIAVGGGTGSISDPLEVIEFTRDEISAAVAAASDFGTYVMAHVYNSKGIRRSIELGVKSIEHANLVDRETLQVMKEMDVWLSPQVSVYTFIPAGYSEGQAEKHRQAFAGIDRLFGHAREIGYDRIVVGSDIISSPEAITTLNQELVARTKWFRPVEILRQATSKAGELLALSGPMNPYPGKLGVIEEGAYADLLLIDGNPLEDIEVMLDHQGRFDLIMKNGVVCRNALEGSA